MEQEENKSGLLLKTFYRLKVSTKEGEGSEFIIQLPD
jgi:hypothetical protein